MNEFQKLYDTIYGPWNVYCDGLNSLQPLDNTKICWIKNNIFINNENPHKIELVNAFLTNSTIKNNNQMMIILPKRDDSVTTAILSIFIILKWFECELNSIDNYKILFFGSTVRTRNQLCNVIFKFNRKRLSLDYFFPQIYVARNDPEKIQEDTSYLRKWNPRLPKIISSLNPADPISIININKPDCIVIDCEDKEKIPFVDKVIKYVKENNIPLIALTQNPLSEPVNDFNRNNSTVFYWPYYNSKEQLEFAINGSSFKEFYDLGVSNVNVILMDTKYDKDLFTVYQNLSKASSLIDNQLCSDAVKIGWNYLRTIELLPIPLDIYEAESPKYWGLRQINELKEVFDKFINELNSYNHPTCSYLSNIQEGLENICIDYENSEEPPIWSTIIKLINKNENENKIFIFPSNSRKELFIFSLLSRYNIDEESLKGNNIFILSLSEYNKQIIKLRQNSDLTDTIFQDIDDKPIHSILIGLPSPILNSKLDLFLTGDNISVLVYAYQLSILEYKVNQWSKSLTPDINNNYKIIKTYNSILPDLSIEQSNERLALNKNIQIINEKGKIIKGKPVKISREYNLTDEFAILLDTSYDTDTDGNTPIGQSYTSEKQDICVENVIEVSFEDSWKILYSPDDIINVIKTNRIGKDIESRLVSSLQNGDNVLFIHGQKKQSLYELIVSRVHKNPSIETHLALINKWHSEFSLSFEKRFKNRNMTHNAKLLFILRELGKRGTLITDERTIHNWLMEKTICPDDKEDLKRLADILDMPFVKKYYKQIHAASHRLAGIHIVLSKQISKWLIEQSSGIINSQNELNGLIDNELGLTINDFRDSLMILKVISINKKSGLFYIDRLGVLERAD